MMKLKIRFSHGSLQITGNRKQRLYGQFGIHAPYDYSIMYSILHDEICVSNICETDTTRCTIAISDCFLSISSVYYTVRRTYIYRSTIDSQIKHMFRINASPLQIEIIHKQTW